MIPSSLNFLKGLCPCNHRRQYVWRGIHPKALLSRGGLLLSDPLSLALGGDKMMGGGSEGIRMDDEDDDDDDGEY